MLRIQKTTLCLAMIFACAGTASITLFLLARKPEGNFLFIAALSAAFGAASLLAFVIVYCSEVIWQQRKPAPHTLTPATELLASSRFSDQFKQRLMVIGERLNIDVPHFCTQAQAPCTAWSLCGSVPQSNSMKLSTAVMQGSPGPELAQDSAGNAPPLPVIQISSSKGSCLALIPTAEPCGKSPCTTSQPMSSLKS